MLARRHGDPAPLMVDVGLHRRQLRVVYLEGSSLKRILDTPVDHLLLLHHLAQLLLELGIGFRVGIRGVWGLGLGSGLDN